MNHTISIFIITVCVCISLQSGAQFNLLNVTLPEPMMSHYAAIYNNTFTVFGGENSTRNSITTSRSTSISISYGLNASPWSLNNVTLPLYIPGLLFYADSSTNINSKSYLINPFIPDGFIRSFKFVYDLTLNKYSTSSTPAHYADHACAVYNRKNNIIYTIGGFTPIIGSPPITKYTQRYHVLNNSWLTNAADTINAKYAAGCSLDANNDYIYYFGGNYYDIQTLDEIQKYSVSDDEWMVLSTTLSTRRRGLRCRLLSSDSNIYCIGGGTLVSSGALDEELVSDVVDVFDPTSDTIINTIHLNVARTYFAATLFNDDKCIIVSGGLGDNGYYQLDPVYLDSIETFGDCTAPTGNPYAAPSNSSTKNPSVAPSKSPKISTNDPLVTETNESNIHCLSMVVVFMGIGFIGFI